MSHVTYNLLHALPCILFKAMLVKTVFILKPLEARKKKTFGDAAAGAMVMDRGKLKIAENRYLLLNFYISVLYILALHFFIVTFLFYDHFFHSIHFLKDQPFKLFV